MAKIRSRRRQTAGERGTDNHEHERRGEGPRNVRQRRYAAPADSPMEEAEEKKEEEDEQEEKEEQELMGLMAGAEGRRNETAERRHPLQERLERTPSPRKRPRSPFMIHSRLYRSGKEINEVREGPRGWVRFKADRQQMVMKTDVLFAGYDQTSRHLPEAQRLCGTVACLVARWSLSHRSHRYTPRANLQNLMVEAAVLMRDSRRLAKLMRRSSNPELKQLLRQHVVAGIEAFGAPQLAILPPLSGSWEGEETPDNQRFDSVWGRVSGCRGSVYVVCHNQHFFVLRVDNAGECWIIDSYGPQLDYDLRRAFVLSFGRRTVFRDEALGCHSCRPCGDSPSSAACATYLRDFLGRAAMRELYHGQTDLVARTMEFQRIALSFAPAPPHPPPVT